MVVGRFAPSPTGQLHYGSLVAALGSWLFARAAGGRWLVRMEDLDQSRVVPGCADDILRTLEALGLEWDGEVICQSRRTDRYHEAFNRLVESGDLYPCACSRSDIARIATAPHDIDGELVYPGTCRNGIREGKEARTWRVRVPSLPVIFDDAIQGTQECDLSRICGDFVLRRGDGYFAYQLAVVVDDAEQGVNQVVRGADLLMSTPRQIHLQRLLDLPTPEYAHLPLVTSFDGSKLSKRDSVLSITTGKNPVKLLTAAMLHLGQDLSPGADELNPRELLSFARSNFNPAHIPRHGAPFPIGHPY